MCELFAISSDKPVRPVKTLRSFYERGFYNPHGVGVAYYNSNREAVLHKQAKMAMRSPLAEKVRMSEETVSDIFIAHVRLASRGLKISYNNTHPFKNEAAGREYIFAHNGTLYATRRFSTGGYHPRGETDSEYAFCYLLSEISKRDAVWSDESFKWLHGILTDINRDGAFNMMMSDGEYLFCYNDSMNHNGGLGFVRREDYSHEGESPAKGVIVSTRPVVSGESSRFKPGELKVFRCGKEVFSSCVIVKEAAVC